VNSWVKAWVGRWRCRSESAATPTGTRCGRAGASLPSGLAAE
jgi:hypothetical protein